MDWPRTAGSRARASGWGSAGCADDRDRHANRAAHALPFGQLARVVQLRRALSPGFGLVDGAAGVADHAAADALDRLGNAQGAEPAPVGVAEGHVPRGTSRQGPGGAPWRACSRRAANGVLPAPARRWLGFSLRQLTRCTMRPKCRPALDHLEAAVHLVAVAVRLAPEGHPVHTPVPPRSKADHRSRRWLSFRGIRLQRCGPM